MPGPLFPVDVSDALRAIPVAGTPHLTACLAFPSGEPLPPASWLSHAASVRLVLRPLPPGMPTRVEALLERALPGPSPQPAGRPWLARNTADGFAVYVQVLQETWTFRGSDGVHVGVNVPTTPIQHTHLASRRYGARLEVSYQYAREHRDLRRMDDFVLGQLHRHVRPAPHQPD